MVKYYSYANGELTEHGEFQQGFVVETVFPTQDEITDIAGSLNITEDDIKALVTGDFDKIECDNIVAAKFNSSLNVMIESNLNYMIVCHDSSNKECAELIHSLWGFMLVSGLINIDASDVSMIFENAAAACMNSIFVTKNGENVENAGAIALSAELLNAINKSKKILFTATVSRNIEFKDIDEIIEKVKQMTPDDSTIVFAITYNEKLSDEIHVTIMSPVL